METAALEMLAQLPSSYVFVNPVKIAALVLVFALWAYFAAWVDKDTVAVNTFRELWNLVVLGSGALAMVLGLFVPMFAVGFLLFLGIDLGVGVAYVLHRNGLVKDEDKVFTPAHIKSKAKELFSGKKKEVKEVKERVRLTGANGKVVPVPSEDPEREQYRLTQNLMFNAFWRRASVIEVAPAGQREGQPVSRIGLQVDGLPVEFDGAIIPRQDGDAVVMYLKQMAALNLEERRKPQKSEIMAAVGENKYKVVVRTDGSAAGEKIALRIIRGEANFKVPDLGFTPRQLEQVEATKEISKGLILLSGPTGSGLTTTIYSFTRNHDRFLQNVQTVEYEREMDLDNVTQNIFVPSGEATFAERLLKLVRADPDIIVLPELRERDSAAIAAKAAAEKQKVYVALPANDVFEALRRWITAVGDKALAAKSLLAVSNQRLVRKLCNECKQAYKPDPAMMRKLNLPADKVLYRPPEPEYDKHGNPIICQACQGSGYAGQTGIFDWVTVDDGLREVIRNSKSMAEIQNYVLKRGGIGMQHHALQKVLDGVTSMKEVSNALRGQSTPSSPRPKPKPKTPPQARGGKA
jgi:type II secretory ATPase GspE/PulE/Tfp pilus assembly ATPase PilB-like protein